MNRHIRKRAMLLAAALLIITTASTRLNADSGMCGGASITLPFTDVASSNIFFCSIAEAFFSGLTNGTTATTYNPSDPVPREQMAAFVTRTMDQSVNRASRRAALDQFWTPQTGSNLASTMLDNGPGLLKSDGADIWVANSDANTVSRVRASDGKLLETWTGAEKAMAVLVAMGKIFVTGDVFPARLYQIDPTQPAGPVTTVTSNLGNGPHTMAYDGQRIWTANVGSPGSVSIITVNPLNVTTVTTGFCCLSGIVYDGTNIWVTDTGYNSLFKLDSNGNILMTVFAGPGPAHPAFDGTNIWVPNATSPTNSVTVVRATGSLAGTVLATLTNNGLFVPNWAVFDGERILILCGSGNDAVLWKASDFTPIGTFFFPTSGFPVGACSDGLNFWIKYWTAPTSKLVRF